MLAVTAPITAPTLQGAVAWLNSKPLILTQLHGKVVLIDFWTYTCVNWRRTLPYVRAWAEKYKAEGLVVIGVHTPEFSFEKDLDNVRWAIKDMHVDYPVAVDSNSSIWNSFSNEYWPALYIIDAKGQIRAHQFGEGAYVDSEREIQALLTESGRKDVDRTLVSVHPSGLEIAADSANLQSPETYVGYERGADFSSPGGAVADVPRLYHLPAQLVLNDWALSGDWTINKEAAALNVAGGRLAYRFHARDLNLIMSPPTHGTNVRFRVLLDGKPPGDAHGDDITAEGYGVVSRQNTYQLIRQRKPIVDRQFEIEFFNNGVQAFDFTFG
jgi:thiol-disulfide isomerase/thioredoxin